MESLAERIVCAQALTRPDPQCSSRIDKQLPHIVVNERSGVGTIAKKDAKACAVESVHAVVRSDPKKSGAILNNGVDGEIGQAVGVGEALKAKRAPSRFGNGDARKKQHNRQPQEHDENLGCRRKGTTTKSTQENSLIQERTILEEEPRASVHNPRAVAGPSLYLHMEMAILSHILNAHMKKFFSFVKIEHTLFSLPLIYSGVLLGSRERLPSIGLFILVLTAATGARTVAFALNRIIDRNIDARNPRTAMRDLPSGRMTLWEAGWVMFAGLALYFGSAYVISDFCFALSPIPLLIFIIYPTMKRYTPLAHFGVGLGLAMGPLGGWFAVSPSFDRLLEPALLALFTLFWVAGFDIIYATLDEEFDKKESLYSFPARFGRETALKFSGLFHLLAFMFLVALFVLSPLSLLALPLLLLTGYLLYLEQQKADDVELAFFKINAVAGFSVFAMVMVGVRV
ncbi:MAG: hypothetical protein C4326_09940 [Ignavibacteria bacterium]